MVDTLRNYSADVLLKGIHIYGGWFGDDDAEELGSALARNTPVDELRFEGCTFGARGMGGIAKALKINTTLTNIFLNSIEGVGDFGAEIMADALASSSTLESLNLSGCGIGALGSRAIFIALKVKTSLKTLCMANNNIGDTGATALAGALTSNNSLTTLNLFSCGIGPLGSRAIADALKINTSLKTLVIDFNDVGDDGAIALAEALVWTKSLTELRLGACGIGIQGAMAIGRALGSNSALPLGFCLVTEITSIVQEASRVRDMIIRRREH